MVYDRAVEQETVVDLPKLRGALHAWAFGPFAIAAVLLVLAAREEDRWPTVAYALSVCGLLGTSALYHRVGWSPRWYLVARRVDHSMIFALIVGTYTPLCLVALRGHDVRATYYGMCITAAVGVVTTLFWTRSPKWLRSAIYVAVGWTGVVVVPQLFEIIGASGLVMLGGGGLAYSVGALVYALKRPDPVPRVFGYHELFHALVIVAAAMHLCLVAFWVI